MPRRPPDAQGGVIYHVLNRRVGRQRVFFTDDDSLAFLRVGRNLGPFFDAWGIPVSDAAKASVADLPPWMPPDWPR